MSAHVDDEKVATPDFKPTRTLSSKGSSSSLTAANVSNVDVTVTLVADASGYAESISPEESKRLRRKLDLHLLPIIFLLYILQFIDKSTLAASSILGIIKDAHLSTDDYNTAASAFYIGYLAFSYPQAWALQRFPVAKWVGFNIFLWAIFIGLHPLCKSFSQLFALRFLLGATEGSVTAGVMLVINMFYTRLEIGQRIGWTLQCNGIAQIINGFISFGVAHIKADAHPRQWQWIMIITAGLSVIVGTIFLWVFPDNPATARFLTKEEKIMVIRRISGNQNGIETKKWKKSQLLEALRDPKTWMFFFFAAIGNLQNGYGSQYSIIIKGFGFNTLQTTLLNIPSGGAQIIGITFGMWLLTKFPNARAYLAMWFFVPSLIGAILLMTLRNKYAELVAFYIFSFGGAPSWAYVVSWVSVTTAGHTKRVVTNAFLLVGYALGQILCTQFWRAQYKPHNLVPWGICLATYFFDWTLIYSLRFHMDRENKRRDAVQAGRSEEEIEDDKWGYVEVPGPDGALVRRRVDKSLLNLTDRENLSFRYAL